MLKLKGVEIRQGAFSLAASFTVERGRRVAVIGPSGAGKSTILGALGGFIPLAKGRVYWDDAEISTLSPGARPVSMLFQDNNLFPHLTVYQNVGLGVRPNLKLTPYEIESAHNAIQRVGLDGMAERRPAELSGGQQSRASLARVLVQKEPIVLLDEPFAALGPALRQEMLDLVRELVDEIEATLLMVTHAPGDVARIADDVIFVEGGQALAPAPAAELLQNPPPALQAYLGS